MQAKVRPSNMQCEGPLPTLKHRVKLSLSKGMLPAGLEEEQWAGHHFLERGAQGWPCVRLWLELRRLHSLLAEEQGSADEHDQGADGSPQVMEAAGRICHRGLSTAEGNLRYDFSKH